MTTLSTDSDSVSVATVTTLSTDSVSVAAVKFR